MTSEPELTGTESTEYTQTKNGVGRFPGWIKVTAIAAASVLAGGLAGAWIYRKSIARLHNTEESAENSKIHMSSAESEDEI